jgi:hypothetical protein
MDIADASLLDLGLGLIAALAVLLVATVLWRILKKALGGCISVGIGCLALVAGLVAIGLFFYWRFGISNLDDILRVLGQ